MGAQRSADRCDPARRCSGMPPATSGGIRARRRRRARTEGGRTAGVRSPRSGTGQPGGRPRPCPAGSPRAPERAQPFGEMPGRLAGLRRHAVVRGEVAQFRPGLQRCRRRRPRNRSAGGGAGGRGPGAGTPAAARGAAAAPAPYSTGSIAAGRVRPGGSARERQRRSTGRRRGDGAVARNEAVVVFVGAGAAGGLRPPWRRTEPRRARGSVRRGPSPVPGNTVPARRGRPGHRPHTPAGHPGPPIETVAPVGRPGA